MRLMANGTFLPEMPRREIILTELEFTILHQIVMSEPEGISELQAEGPEVVAIDLLCEHGFIVKKGYRWHVTEKGVQHIMPRKKSVIER